MFVFYFALITFQLRLLYAKIETNKEVVDIKKNNLNHILKKNYILLLLITSLILVTVTTTLSVIRSIDYKNNVMNESLKQASINLNAHIEAIDDYLSIVHASQITQSSLSAIQNKQIYDQTSVNTLNQYLLSVDLFKKTIDSIEIFVFSSSDTYPKWTNNLRSYSNSIFSSADVEKSAWFNNTLAEEGRTYWFVDIDSRGKPYVSATRIIVDCSNPTESFGVLRINISMRKFVSHCGEISFGNKGSTFLLLDNAMVDTQDIIVQLSPEGYSEQINDLQADHLVVTQPLSINRWEIIGSISYWILYNEVILDLLVSIAIFATCVFIASALFVKICNKVVAPIENLCRNMQSSQKIDLPVLYPYYEVNQLYQTYNTMLDNIDLLISKKEETAEQLKQAELSVLLAQMNPHFIYNTLELINALISTEQNQKANRLIENLGSFLRNSLNKGNDYIHLSKEIEHVVSYFKIQEFRYSHMIQLHLHIPDPLPDYYIIKLLLQPLVENSIVHGFANLPYPGIIDIRIDEDNDFLNLSVVDNGIGSDADWLNNLIQESTFSHNNTENYYCVQNVQLRLQQCYGEQAGIFYTENETSGITAHIFIPKCRLMKGESSC